MSSRNLNLNSDVAELTRELCDIESVSGNEREIADAIESALKLVGHLSVVRDGDAVVAAPISADQKESLLQDTSTPFR